MRTRVRVCVQLPASLPGLGRAVYALGITSYVPVQFGYCLGVPRRGKAAAYSKSEGASGRRGYRADAARLISHGGS